ncbi:MAG: hypothetical protein RUMPE_00715 [Eubacteriales bacterium SKADARSKE-1]|nr:hypothetical protein [Eubacteriales bacterium SKADARSKE-1]
MKAIDFVKNNPDLLKKAKACSTKEEFISLAKLNNVHFEDMSLETAYDFLNEGTDELREDALEVVAGGSGKIENKLRSSIKEAADPSKKTGNFQEVSPTEAENLLGSGSKGVFLDDKTLKWYKLT